MLGTVGGWVRLCNGAITYSFCENVVQYMTIIFFITVIIIIMFIIIQTGRYRVKKAHYKNIIRVTGVKYLKVCLSYQMFSGDTVKFGNLIIRLKTQTTMIFSLFSYIFQNPKL